jgi:hypothetical protein
MPQLRGNEPILGLNKHIINKSSPHGTQRTQDVCTIFLFIMDFNPGVFQKQLNRVQLYKRTNSI